MTVFWIITALLTAIAGFVVLTGARLSASRLVATDEAETDRLSGARELAELDRMKARGLLDEAAWVAARAEAGRRILSAQRAEGKLASSQKDGLIILGSIGATAALALGLYIFAGMPGYGDQPYRQRIAQWATQPETLEPAQVAAVMGEVVRDKPDDVMALSMLGAARFEAGDAVGAASAFRRALNIQPGNAQNWARLGESLVRANEGRIGPDAEAAFREAVKRDADQFGARYYLGEVALNRGEIAVAEEMWSPLMQILNAQDPRGIEMRALLAKARAES